MADKRCCTCGELYPIRTRNVAQYEASKYCSSECYGKAKQRIAEERRAAIVRQCRQCGKPFSPARGQISAFETRKYCSPECAGQGKQRKIDALYANIRIDPVSGCHIWTGARTAGGYGRTRFNGRRHVVHRVIWEHANGAVPEGLQLDHYCRNNACCNIRHLRIVTPRENILPTDNVCALNARRNKCPKCGEPYTVHPTGTRRYCKPCQNKHIAEYAKRRRSGEPEFRERQLAATERYREKLKNQPEVITARQRNESCPKCGGPYSTFPNGARYCKPCRNQWQRERDKRIQEK